MTETGHELLHFITGLKTRERKILLGLMHTGVVSFADTGDLKIVIAYGIG